MTNYSGPPKINYNIEVRLSEEFGSGAPLGQHDYWFPDQQLIKDLELNNPEILA
jgi:hypothetical protein